LKVREDEICDCGYKIDTKKLDLKKKISKNNQEYTSTIEKYINKIKAIDTSLPYSITPKNRSPTPTPTTISSAANLLS
jgi:hypothetical protein